MSRNLTTTRTTVTGSSLAERIRNAVAANSPSGSVPRTSALLLDNSGSMCGSIGANVRAIDELRRLADGFKDVRRFVFNSHAEELAPTAAIGEPTGGTNMAEAFAHVKSRGVTHVVLITDGHPDDEKRALAAAVGLRIDIFYVGPDPAPDFLRRLCGATGGKYGKASLDALKELAASVRGLLGSGAIAL